MELAPFGVLNEGYRNLLKDGPGEAGVFQPMKKWPKGKDAYHELMEKWLEDVKKNIWPEWKNGKWLGAAKAQKEESTKKEMELAARLYFGTDGGRDIMDEDPDIPKAPDGCLRSHKWHYEIEDAFIYDLVYSFITLPNPTYNYRASRNVGSNFIVYNADFEVSRFEKMFWDRIGEVVPATWDIKQQFQRPRPWTAATLLDVRGFRWLVAGGEYATHTGIHPSLLSGHCIQGILGGCQVFSALLENHESLTRDCIRAIQKYMVDWGDRRVFAGVHYMTDNIASWTLARRLMPHLFSKEVGQLAVQAITENSRVFADIVRYFDKDDPALVMLLTDFPEARPAA
ncbi:hypothetical protein [Paracoccus sp. AK26]|uniref:hypothetical protein n=1 Tax=Paracoccus sp. AK26 TaxID=2589076 RepID=UPI0014284C7C|nr:hypothetical protein [Paracoccus sp. AK26]QIR86487.1 hypothetical protein FIU66_14305 [Paracoccus sp. AK26]